MGNRDFGKRETKKTKKTEKKPTKISLEPQFTVEVIKKGKKHTEEEE
jgi:hypothetical protein